MDMQKPFLPLEGSEVAVEAEHAYQATCAAALTISPRASSDASGAAEGSSARWSICSSSFSKTSVSDTTKRHQYKNATSSVIQSNT